MVFEMTIILVDREILIGAPSSQWWTQLSSTIAGGLTFATMLTLVATPAMLVLGAKGADSAWQWRALFPAPAKVAMNGSLMRSSRG
jgi:multidrug efflux pump